MKIYLKWALLLVLFAGCSKSDNGQTKDDEKGAEQLPEYKYTVVLNNNSVSTAKSIRANSELMLLSNDQSEYGTNSAYDFKYKNNYVLTTLSLSNCLGKIVNHNFYNDTKISFNVFSESENCNITVKAITHSSKYIFIAYEEFNESTLKTSNLLRKIKLNAAQSFEDIEIGAQIKDLDFSKNDVYVLLENNDKSNSLLAIDQDTSDELLNLYLGSGAMDLVKNPDNNILVSYNYKHLVINNTTYASKSETKYDEQSSPQFSNSVIKNFGTDGKLYYAMSLNSDSDENIIDTPSVYDFDKSLTVMYYYKNFLTEKLRSEIYKIGATTMIVYDHDNEIIILGYQHHDNPSTGGLLRIKPVPNPEFIDHIDLAGVPNFIFIN